MAGMEGVGVRLNVAVIGAGWAGLSTAVEMAARGIPVTVHEAAPNLGGRARGFEHDGKMLDNGQHLLLGAYRETQRLMGMVGVDVDAALLRLPLRLETPGHLRLATPALPAPLHLLAGLLTAEGLGWRERQAAIRFMTGQRLSGFRLEKDCCVTELLADQPKKLVRLLWEPLCLAALNTPIAVASAQVFLNVLRDSFSRARADSDLLLPRTDLSSLFPKAAARFIEQHGGTVRTSSGVTQVECSEYGVLIDGEKYSLAVCATAPSALPRLLGHIPEMADVLATTGRMTWQPIATIYLQYPVNVTLPFPMLGLQGGHAQWVIDRGAVCGEHGLLAAVISAEGPYQQMERDALAAAVHKELKALIGTLPDPESQQVIVEKRATFACVAGMQRPSNATAHPRIFLAGDYTTGDYPATLEGAVRSGVRCARLVASNTSANRSA